MTQRHNRDIPRAMRSSLWFQTGHFQGAGNRSVDILASKENYLRYYVKNALDNEKLDYYAATSIQDYNRDETSNKKDSNGVSCFEMLYETYGSIEEGVPI